MKELIVVTRYNENIDWLKNVKQDYLVYNKGESDLPTWVKNVVHIPNIGREEYGYITYIHDNYDNLADRVVFCQGGVLYHSPDFLELLKVSDKFGPIQPLSFGYSHNVPAHKYIIYDISINDLRVHVDLFNEQLLRYSKISSQTIPIDNGVLTKGLSHFLETENIRTAMHNLLKLKINKVNGLDLTPMCYAGIFAVNKENILLYSKDYYRSLLDLSEKIFFSHHNMTLKECLSNTHKYETDNHVRTFGLIMELMWLRFFEYDLPNHYLLVGKT